MLDPIERCDASIRPLMGFLESTHKPAPSSAASAALWLVRRDGEAVKATALAGFGRLRNAYILEMFP
jgi:hypothetical protein